MMEPATELEISKEEFLNNNFPVSKRAILEDALFPRSLKLLSADVPELTMSEYTREELMLHCMKDEIGFFIEQFETLIPGWLKVEKGIVKIDRSRGKYHRNKLSDESHFNRRWDPKMKEKMGSLYNYIDSSKDMLSSKLLHNILFKSGTFDDSIYKMEVEFELLLFLAPHWMSSIRSNTDTIYRFNKLKTKAVKADSEFKRVAFITGGKGKPQDLLLGSKTLHELVELRGFFVRKEQEHNCVLCGHKLFPTVLPCSNDILEVERLAMLSCCDYFHRECIVDRLTIDIEHQQFQNEMLGRDVRALMEDAKLRVMKKMRKCETNLDSIKEEVERYSRQLKRLEEPIMPKCPVCSMSVSFP